MSRRRNRSQRGQSAVETAIVMPLFVFLILGLLQLALLHQARVLTKYAAYKAVRVGSIHNAKKSAMKRAAAAVLLPMMGKRTNLGGGQGMYYRGTAARFGSSWGDVKKKLSDDTLLKLTVCDPTGPPIKGDFDDPDGTMGPGDWADQNRGRLAIQIQNNQEMVIPFANSVIFYILVAQEKAELYKVLRMRAGNDENHKDWLSTRNAANKESRTIDKFLGLAASGTYIIPLRASWSMRMQSNFLDTNADFKLPQKNFCRVAWEVMGKGGRSQKGVE